MRRLVIGFFALGSLFILPSLALATTTTPEDIKSADPKVIPFVQQVSIPGFSQDNSIIVGDKDNPSCSEGYVCVYTIGSYINAIYAWGAGAGITFAIVLIMIGGLQYIIASATGDTSKAIERMRNATIGLVLVLSVTAVLKFANPAITSFSPVRVEILDPVSYVVQSRDVGIGAITAAGKISIPAGAIPDYAGSGVGAKREDFAELGISCPGSGGSAAVRDIALSFKDKVNYRLGGKIITKPAYPFELPPKRSASKVKRDSAGFAYGYFCPDDSLCLDCSGFLDLVSECAGLADRNSKWSTNAIFESSPKVTSCDGEDLTLKDGSTHELEAGDFIGFGGQHSSTGIGHIWMYIGDGEVINSAGSGRSGKSAVKIQSLEWACSNYPLYLRALNT